MFKYPNIKVGIFSIFLLGLLFWILEGPTPPTFESTGFNAPKIPLQITTTTSSDDNAESTSSTHEPSEVEKSFKNCFQEPPPASLEPLRLLQSLRKFGEINKKSLHFKNSHEEAQRILVQRKDGETAKLDYEIRFFGVDAENLPVPLPKLFETVEKQRIKDRVEALVTHFGEINYSEEEYNSQIERYNLTALFINEKLTELSLRTLEKSLLCSENGCQCL